MERTPNPTLADEDDLDLPRGLGGLRRAGRTLLYPGNVVCSGTPHCLPTTRLRPSSWSAALSTFSPNSS